VHTSLGDATSTATLTIDPHISDFTPKTGPEGTQVTITGTGLAGVASITFNGVAAPTVDHQSATSITVEVPHDPGTGVIEVTRPANPTFGTSAASADSATNFAYLYTHNNGLGGTYLDVNPLNTFTQTAAAEAAQSWNNGTLTSVTCSGEAAVQMDFGGQSATWVWGGGGLLQGHVSPPSATPLCPLVTDPSWN
jgi:hypothetical protein